MPKSFFLYFLFFLTILFTFFIKSLALELYENYETTSKKNDKKAYTNENVSTNKYYENPNNPMILSNIMHHKNIHDQNLFLIAKNDKSQKVELKYKIKKIHSSNIIRSSSKNLNDLFFDSNNYMHLESFEGLRALREKYKKEYTKNIFKYKSMNPCKNINVEVLTDINEDESINNNFPNSHLGNSIGNNNKIFTTKEGAFTLILGSKTHDLISDNIKNIFVLSRGMKLKLELGIEKKEWDDFGNTISAFFKTNCKYNYIEKFRNFSFEEYKKACVSDLIKYDIIDKRMSDLLLTTLSIKNFRLKVLSLFIKDEIIRDIDNSLIFEEFKKLYFSIYFTSCINKLGKNYSIKGYEYGFEVAICMNLIQEKLIYEINHLKNKELITVGLENTYFFKKNYEDLSVKDKIKKIIIEKNLELDSDLINKWLTNNEIEGIFQKSFIRLIVGIPFLESSNNKVPDTVVSKYYLRICDGDLNLVKEI